MGLAGVLDTSDASSNDDDDDDDDADSDSHVSSADSDDDADAAAAEADGADHRLKKKTKKPAAEVGLWRETVAFWPVDTYPAPVWLATGPPADPRNAAVVM